MKKKTKNEDPHSGSSEMKENKKFLKPLTLLALSISAIVSGIGVSSLASGWWIWFFVFWVILFIGIETLVIRHWSGQGHLGDTFLEKVLTGGALAFLIFIASVGSFAGIYVGLESAGLGDTMRGQEVEIKKAETTLAHAKKSQKINEEFLIEQVARLKEAYEAEAANVRIGPKATALRNELASTQRELVNLQTELAKAEMATITTSADLDKTARGASSQHKVMLMLADTFQRDANVSIVVPLLALVFTFTLDIFCPILLTALYIKYNRSSISARQEVARIRKEAQHELMTEMATKIANAGSMTLRDSNRRRR